MKAVLAISHEPAAGRAGSPQPAARGAPGTARPTWEDRLMVPGQGRQARRPSHARPRSESGSLMTEMVVALGLLAFTLLPLSVSFAREQATARALYHRAVAIALVDGEIEALAAGGWRAFAPGTHEYPVRAEAARNLPAGRFLLTLTNEQVRLEWLPATRGGGGRVARAWRLPAGAVDVRPVAADASRFVVAERIDVLCHDAPFLTEAP